MNQILHKIYNRMEKFLYAYKIRSTESMCLPDFLGIGAQKAGTTWLYENLRHHPDVHIPFGKEMHYFDWEFHKPLQFYSEKFESELRRIKGEITPGYSILPIERIRFIRTIMPDVKLIFLMRNPIDRAWSHAIMELVKRPKKHLMEVDDTSFYTHFESEHSLKRGNYLGILDNWLKVFRQEQLYIGIFEDIEDCPQKILREVFRHIGVSVNVDWNVFPFSQVILPPDSGRQDDQVMIRDKKENIAMPQRYRQFLTQIYRQDNQELYNRFGTPIDRWL